MLHNLIREARLIGVDPLTPAENGIPIGLVPIRRPWKDCRLSELWACRALLGVESSTSRFFESGELTTTLAPDKRGVRIIRQLIIVISQDMYNTLSCSVMGCLLDYSNDLRNVHWRSLWALNCWRTSMEATAWTSWEHVGPSDGVRHRDDGADNVWNAAAERNEWKMLQPTASSEWVSGYGMSQSVIFFISLFHEYWPYLPFSNNPNYVDSGQYLDCSEQYLSYWPLL